MKVLVTGACGFIGRHVARHYAEAGWTVMGLGLGGWSEEEWRSWGLSMWHESNITFEALESCAGVPDVIVHCAGSSSVGRSICAPHQDFLDTVVVTAALLEFVRVHASHSRVVYPSSAGVYGMATRFPMAEVETPNPVSPYGVHKLMAEQLCRSYAGNYDISIAVVRLFSVYGPGLRKQLLWDASKKITEGENGFFGSGDETRDWLHISDVVTLLALAGEKASSDCPVVNGGTGEDTTVRAVLLELFAAYGQNGSPKFSGANRVGDPVHYVADITRARAWGWNPRVAWRDGVCQYAKWFKEEAS